MFAKILTATVILRHNLIIEKQEFLWQQ